ncbi:MAG: type IV pilus biogenesis/stability protein PilW [Gammaproteobacteria bacterium]
MKKNLIVLSVLLMTLFISACVAVVERSNADLEKASLINAKLGLAYLQKGSFKTANSKLLKALEQDSDNAVAHLYMAELQKILKVKDKANEHYKKAIALDPEYTRAKNNYGVFLCANGQYQQSVILFADVLQDPLYSEKIGVYENLGLCEQLRGNMHLAERHFRHALKLDNNLPKSLLGMTQISFDSGLYKPAKRYYARYLALARQTPESLWIGFLLERKYKNKKAAESYSTILRVKFPDSEEAILLDKLEGKDGLE